MVLLNLNFVCAKIQKRCWFYGTEHLYCLFAVFSGGDTDLFSVVIEHNGFFSGIGTSLEYCSASVAVFDNCSAETWSILWIDEFLKQLGYERDGRLTVYWNVPGKYIWEGIV